MRVSGQASLGEQRLKGGAIARGLVGRRHCLPGRLQRCPEGRDRPAADRLGGQRVRVDSSVFLADLDENQERVGGTGPRPAVEPDRKLPSKLAEHGAHATTVAFVGLAVGQQHGRDLATRLGGVLVEMLDELERGTVRWLGLDERLDRSLRIEAQRHHPLAIPLATDPAERSEPLGAREQLDHERALDARSRDSRDDRVLERGRQQLGELFDRPQMRLVTVKAGVVHDQVDFERAGLRQRDSEGSVLVVLAQLGLSVAARQPRKPAPGRRRWRGTPRPSANRPRRWRCRLASARLRSTSSAQP